MNFHSHSNLAGKHAFLSPSNHSWVRYDEDKLSRVFFNAMTAAKGTELHAFACHAIKLGVRLPENEKTLNHYVNDAIGFRMTPEQTLFYSDNCYGTCDAISFRTNKLRIHDLKNGLTPASMEQLEVYAAIFCLEYRFRPFEIEIELRIYQNDQVLVEEPDPDVIFHIMDKIVTFDKHLNSLKLEVTS